MDNNRQTNNGFTYIYSAREQAELKRIRDKYSAPTETEDKMARLRRLDACVTGTAQAWALVLGVIGTLLLGFGMSLIMSGLAEVLGLSGAAAVAIGITAGIIGGGLACLAYPAYNAILGAMRRRHGPEILRLTDELMK